MENEFQSYLESDKFCLQECFSKCYHLCCEAMCTYCQDSGASSKSAHYLHVQYRPLVDSNMLEGNIQLPFVPGGSYYFPQTHHTIWPEHLHYEPSCVVSEQPHHTSKPFDHSHRQSRIFSTFRAKRPHLNLRSKARVHFSHPSLAQSSVDDPDTPSLTFACMYDIQGSILTVTVKFASNLGALMHKHKEHTELKKKKCITSITAYLLPSKNEILNADTPDQAHNPVFNKEFVFRGVPVGELEEETLVFHIYHNRVLIGEVKLPLKTGELLGYTICKHIDVISESVADESRVSAGDIQIALTYLPETEVIHGVVLRTANLRQHNILHMHPPRPYINIYLTYKGKRYAKWKSTVHFDPTVPIYNEPFQFNISKMEVTLITLCIHVKEYHSVSLNNLIGTVQIGSSITCNAGAHWQEVVNSPHQKISHWHTIVPEEASIQSERMGMKEKHSTTM